MPPGSCDLVDSIDLFYQFSRASLSQQAMLLLFRRREASKGGSSGVIRGAEKSLLPNSHGIGLTQVFNDLH